MAMTAGTCYKLKPDLHDLLKFHFKEAADLVPSESFKLRSVANSVANHATQRVIPISRIVMVNTYFTGTMVPRAECICKHTISDCIAKHT